MEIKLFGWTFTNQQEEVAKQENEKTFSPPIYDDGAVNVAEGGSFGTYIDLEGTVKTEAELVSRYRTMANQPEIDKAVNEITNEAIVKEKNKDIVEINLEDLEVSDKVKKVMQQEFENVLQLMDFEKTSYDMFRRWYVDGRSYFHVIIDMKAPQDGIKEIRYIDPRTIRKIREVQKKKDKNTGALMQITKSEYFVYNERGFHKPSTPMVSSIGTNGIRIQKDSIIHLTSGLMDGNNQTVLSYLHPAIKFLNELRALEDSSIIYHLSRAPERRIFNVDVGNLPKHKAEQHVMAMMTKHKNKIQYNATTGQHTDNRKFMTMLEDYWFPKRADGSGTTIDILQGGTQLSQLLESIEYFQDRLFRSLQVPISRMKPEAVYNIGRATEITRDEVNFTKFIDRIRGKFSELFYEALGRQLILKEYVSPEDWEQFKKYVKFEFTEDTYFSDLKNMEILSEKILRLRDIDEFAGKYVSHTWVRKNILKQSEEEMEMQDKEMMEELKDPRFMPPVMDDPGQGGPPNGGN